MQYLHSLSGIKNKRAFQTITAIAYDCLLFMILGNFFLYRCTSWQDQKIYYISADTILTIILVCMWICTALELFYSPLRALLAAALSLLYTLNAVSYTFILLFELLIPTLLANLGTEKNNMNMWLFIHLFFAEIMFILMLKGLVVSQYASEGKFSFGSPGSSFGLVHPNSSATFFMSVLLMVWLYKNRKTWQTFLLFIPAALIVFYLTWSRTVFAVMLAFPIIVVIIEKLQRIHQRTAAILIGSIPIVMILITLGMSLYALNRSKGVPNTAFWLRFTDFRAFINSPVTLFGNYGSSDYYGMWFDNMYYWLTVYCGIITAVLFFAAYSYMNIRLLKQGRTYLLAISVMLLCYTIMENALIYPFHFFVPLLAFARTEKGIAQPILQTQ